MSAACGHVTGGVSTVSRRDEVRTNSARSRHARSATLAVVATVTTPWGKAEVLDELKLPQRAGERRFASVIQLLEAGDGERLVRFAYTTDGQVRRGPVTFRARDLERLRAGLERSPALKEVLSL
jgi:hypothetical protein